jgi:rod shape determining protein RodA
MDIKRTKEKDLKLYKKFTNFPWAFFICIFSLFLIGVAIQYSAAGGSMQPWAIRQLMFAGISMPIFFFISLIDIRFLFRIGYHVYFLGLFMLVAVMAVGVEGGLGAQRWLGFGEFRFQPSELAKVFLVLALAKYYHTIHINNLHKIKSLIIPVMIIGCYAALVLIQPNLGTASIICMVGVGLIFAVGVSWKYFLTGLILVICAMPVLWANMHDYQKKRVEVFLNPEEDPLRSGYNLIQSKIAIGSGGLFGKGFVQGSQSQLNFVPEQQTDFVFSIVAEEFGFVGSIGVLFLYSMAILLGVRIANSCKSTFARVLSYGIILIMFIHVFVNVGMVMGLLPVVGVPLPLLSYGGSSLISTFMGFAMVMNCYIHRNQEIFISADEDYIDELEYE